MDNYSSPGRPSGSLKPIFASAAIAFLAGALLVGYFAWRSGYDFGVGDEPAPAAQVEEAIIEPGPLLSPTPTPTATASEAAATERVERVAEQQGGIDQRLAAAEQRLARLDLQAQAAAGNAARAEGLLIAFAARRSLDRGADLGYLADQLRLRFGDAKPNSVDTVIEFSRNPVTLDVLVARLEGLAPELADANNEPLIERIGHELSQLFAAGARLDRDFGRARAATAARQRRQSDRTAEPRWRRAGRIGQPRISSGTSPETPRASSMNQCFSAGVRWTPAMPKRRTAEAARPGTPNRRVRPSVASATMNESSPRHRS